MRRVACAAAVAFLLLVDGGHASPPAVTLSVAQKDPELLYQYTKQRCNDLDYPDVPTRAFWQPHVEKVVWVIGASQSNFRSFSDSLRDNTTDIHRQCDDMIIKSGPIDPTTPQAYNSKNWMTSIYTEDGHKVTGLIHMEFHGEKQKNSSKWCPSHELGKCWYANILHSLSDNQGQHYTIPPVPARVAIASPFPYVPDLGRQGQGTMHTNMFRNYSDPSDPHVYVMVLQSVLHGYRQGVCLYRTTDPTDPALWRGWNGSEFSVRTVDPYQAPPGFIPAEHVCKPVTRSPYRFSVFYSKEKKVFVSMSAEESYIGYSTSTNLFDWSEGAKLMDINGMGGSIHKNRLWYPSVLDDCGLPPQGSHPNISIPTSLMFDLVCDRPRLFLTRLNAATRKYHQRDRDLVAFDLLLQ